MGAMSADLELDALKDAADAEILAVHGALGRYVPLIAAFCRSRCAAAEWALAVERDEHLSLVCVARL